MSYRVIKTIKGRRYIYEQRTWREGKRVRTECRYIGPADAGVRRRRLARKIADFIKANAAPRYVRIDEEQLLKEYNARTAREQQARELALAQLHEKYGLRLPNTSRPAEAPAITRPAADLSAEVDARESPSKDEGQGTQNS